MNQKRNKKENHFMERIISGGQIGADQGALAAAQEKGYETGGTAPVRWMTITGPNRKLLRDTYGLQELVCSSRIRTSTQYKIRSMKNVEDSDGTIAYRKRKSHGTDKTLGYCQTGKWIMFTEGIPYLIKPALIINPAKDDPKKIADFITKHNIKTLNVCGNRGGKLWEECVHDHFLKALDIVRA